MEPTFQDVPEIPLGDPAAESVTLNYHDCIGRHMFWFQDGIRSLKGNFSGTTASLIDATNSQRPLAFWPVNVMADGEYIIELRRYPRELNAAISANIPPGDPVYDQQSHRSENGSGFPAIKAQLWVGDEKQSVEVSKDAAAAEFRMKLKKGSRRIAARFTAVDGRSLDSFYVYVRKSK